MSYHIHWEPRGAIKYFTNTVSADDLLKSENEVLKHPDFASLKFVISVYLTALDITFSESDRIALRSIRSDAYQKNPSIKYAIVSEDERIISNIRDLVASGEVQYKTAIFTAYDEALGWVNR